MPCIVTSFGLPRKKRPHPGARWVDNGASFWKMPPEAYNECDLFPATCRDSGTE
jgi:hypothetical protein